MTPAVTGTTRDFALMWVSGQWDHGAEPGIRSRLLPHGLGPFVSSIWWDGIHCLWDWWKITTRPPPTPTLFSPLGAGDVALMRWYGEKCDLALGSGMFLLRLRVSGTRQGTHERISLSGRKDVQSKSNEDQNTWADLRTCMPHIIQACRATPLLTSLVFFSRSFKVDKVRALISRARYD